MSAEKGTPLLSLRQVHVSYGSVQAVVGLDLDIYPKEIFALLGSNGAGKTSTLRAISGLVPLARGSITLKGQTILSHEKFLQPEKIVALGLGHVPEGRGIFTNLSVEENLQLGSYLRSDHKEIEDDLEMALSYFPRLKERLWQNAGTLSGGEQQMLAVARALMARPQILLLDEPSLGLAPQLTEVLFEVLMRIHETQGVSLFLVEQNAASALDLAHRGAVLEAGVLTTQGSASDLKNSPEVRRAYLGES